MKKLTFGAEPKKVAALGGLLLVFLVILWFNMGSSDSGGPPAAKSSTASVAVSSGTGAVAPPVVVQPRGQRGDPARPQAKTPQRGGAANRGVLEEFRPSVKAKRGEEAVDLAAIDPTLHFDRLARLQKVAMEGSTRNLFEIGAAPPPVALPKVDKIQPGPIGPVAESKPAAPATPPPAPPPPPITLKFYGFLASPRGGPERGFFLDGEEIIIATRDELVRGKYKIVRVGRTSAVVEDVPNKNQQTLPLVQESQS